MTVADLPAFNTALNGASIVLVAIGVAMIKSGRRPAHRLAMLGAVACSTLFLLSYLYYHFHAGATRFAGTGGARTLYFTVLISHTVLAALVPLLVGTTLALALKGRFDRHRVWARLTVPVWLYVSVTGILVYAMLYHLFAPGA